MKRDHPMYMPLDDGRPPLYAFPFEATNIFMTTLKKLRPKLVFFANMADANAAVNELSQEYKQKVRI
jgi:hypothetical protein